MEYKRIKTKVSGVLQAATFGAEVADGVALVTEIGVRGVKETNLSGATFIPDAYLVPNHDEDNTYRIERQYEVQR